MGDYCTVVVGGGRWARVIVGVLANHVDPTTTVTVLTRYNRKSMADWVTRNRLSGSIEVRDEYPQREPGTRNLAVIANAAHDHERACDDALSRGYNILVEKPFTLTHAASSRIQARAASLGLKCLSANVLRFGRHIEAFARRLPPQSDIGTLRIEWADPAGETRYGEAKRYDARITVVADVMPHVASILMTLFGEADVELQRVTVSDGGARVAAEFRMGETAVEVSMQRNASARARHIAACGDFGTIALDFATEPGTISHHGHDKSADPEWHTHPTPLTAMLRSALSSVRNGGTDPRLDMRAALAANRMIELVAPEYSTAQLGALRRTLAQRDSLADSAVHYALSEIMQAERRLSAEEITRKAAALQTAEQSWGALSDHELLRNLYRLPEKADA